jgi:hypothetical protein
VFALSPTHIHKKLVEYHEFVINNENKEKESESGVLQDIYTRDEMKHAGLSAY